MNIYDPLDPAYTSDEAQIARLQHLLDYSREHAPDATVECWLYNQIEDVRRRKAIRDALSPVDPDVDNSADPSGCQKATR